MYTSHSLHFITNPDRSAPADARTEHLGHLDALVVDHFRNALNALDVPSDAGLTRASVRLHYAVECASMTYGLMHRITDTLRDFRTVVDAAIGSDENRWFVVDLALAECLTGLRTTKAPKRARRVA